LACSFTFSFSHDGFAAASFYYAFFRNPLPWREEKQRHPHQQIRRNKKHQRLVATD
jgi:hypothetical protein